MSDGIVREVHERGHFKGKKMKEMVLEDLKKNYIDKVIERCNKTA